MSNKAGIWIDREHAILIMLANGGQGIATFIVGEPKSFPPTTESRAQHAYTPNDFQPEDRIERKEQAARKQMYDAILTTLQGVESLIVLGPGEAKKEFAKHIESKRPQHMLVEIETADKMTEPQLAAKVRQHFGPERQA